MSRLALLALLLALGACSTTSFTCTDYTRGACELHTTRFLTDTVASFALPNGVGASVSSNPNAAGTAAAFATIDKAVGLAGAALKAGAAASVGAPLAAVEP